MPDGLSDDAALSDAFRAALLADLRPLGALQDIVAERIVIGLWRSLRGVEAAKRPRAPAGKRWLCERCPESLRVPRGFAGGSAAAGCVTGYRGGADRDWSVAVAAGRGEDRKSTRLNSSHLGISYAVFCL